MSFRNLQLDDEVTFWIREQPARTPGTAANDRGGLESAAAVAIGNNGQVAEEQRAVDPDRSDEASRALMYHGIDESSSGYWAFVAAVVVAGLVVMPQPSFGDEGGVSSWLPQPVREFSSGTVGDTDDLGSKRQPYSAILCQQFRIRFWRPLTRWLH